MKLSSFVAADRMVLELTASGRSEVLEKLTAPLLALDIVTDAAQFIDDLVRREDQISTVMENGVAIPHARSHAVRRLSLVVGIAGEEGIGFDTDSGLLSQLFFCIAIPSFAPTSHISLLQTLARFARDANRVEKILKSKTPAIASKYLSSFKG